MKKLFLWTIVVLTFISMLSTFSIIGCSQEKTPVFYVLAHGGITNPFWQRAQKGCEDAGKELGVETHFYAPAEFDVQELVNMLETVIARKPDGIACTLTVVEALDEPLRRAISMGIPVVLLDADDPRPEGERIPAIGFIGWDAYGLGVQSANKVMNDLKIMPKHVLVGIHEAGNIGLENRVRGLIDTFAQKSPGTKVETILTTVDMSKAVSVYKAYLTANPDVDMIFAAGSASGHPAIKFLEEEGLTGKVLLVTADLSEEIINAIDSGVVAFTTDCQQYLWGWQSVVMLFKYAQYGIAPISPTYTGPSIVDKSNVEQVRNLVKAGVR